MQITSLKPQEINTLLDAVDNRELYDAVMSFIESAKGGAGKFPCSTEEFGKRANEAIDEFRAGKAKPISKLRK